jgi:hypothetical protein
MTAKTVQGSAHYLVSSSTSVASLLNELMDLLGDIEQIALGGNASD